MNNIANAKRIYNSKLVILAIVFTLLFMFLTLEIPLIINNYLLTIFPDINPVIQPHEVAAFINLIRPIGYIFLFIIFVLIIIGFLIKKKNVTITGSFLLFLPTFGQFVSTMLFLAGIGILQVIWLPLWYPNLNLLNLGYIINLPFLLIEFLNFLIFPNYSSFSLIIIYALIIIGLFIFMYSIIIWFHEKRREKDVFHVSIYKYSRHPQYLGFLIWSYGMHSLANFLLKPMPFGALWIDYSLPWLLSALIIICMALFEEIKMKQEHLEKYSIYQKKTPFLVPLPKSIKSILIFPLKLVYRKHFPEDKKEVLFIILFWGGVIILFSLIMVVFNLDDLIEQLILNLKYSSYF